MSENQDIDQLPKDWKLIKLGEVGKIETGTTPSKSNSAFYGRDIPFFKPSDLQQGVNTILASDNLSKLGFEHTRKLPKNSILVTCIGATIGKTGLIKVEGTSNQQINSIIPNEFHNPKFVFYQVISNNFQNRIKSNASSTTLPILNKSKFQQLDFITTNLKSQENIVSKIEELFSELDKSIENLRTAQQQLKSYRQAVLKWAFDGKLTEEWRKKNGTGGRIPPGAPAERSRVRVPSSSQEENGELPDRWEKVQIKEVAETYGGYAFKSGEFKNVGKYQVLRMGNIRPGILRYDESPVFLDSIDDNVLKRSLLKLNDVVITQTGTRKKRDYGFTSVISKENLLLNQRIAAIRFKEHYLPKFFLYYSWTNDFKDQFFANETGNVGQGNVGMNAVTQTLVPYCSFQEQKITVELIESRLSVTDKMEETINQSLQRAEALRQSILKKAFEGRLV
jgi:type I restriction enzyme S subunit